MMGLVPNLEFMKINTKVTEVFLMLKLPYTNSGVKLFQYNFLACITRMGGPIQN